MEEKYNPTCIVTGKQDKLVMKAFRNNYGDMVGWVFLNEEVQADLLDKELVWEFKTLNKELVKEN